MTHAGFWVDGAVRKPEARHADEEGEVLVKTKSNSRVPFLETFSDVTGYYYWLDTTPRESLTPEELLSVLKVLWPKCEAVFRPDDFETAYWQANNRFQECETQIDWGSLTQYPPPVEPQWIRVTRENVGQYLFRLCRCRDSESESWQDGRIVGWDIEDDDCLVDGDFDPIERVMKFNFVEVQNAPAS